MKSTLTAFLQLAFFCAHIYFTILDRAVRNTGQKKGTPELIEELLVISPRTPIILIY